MAADKPLTVTGNFTVNNEGAVTLAGTLVVVGNVAVEAANGLSVSSAGSAGVARDTTATVVTEAFPSTIPAGITTVYIVSEATVSGDVTIGANRTVIVAQGGTLNVPEGGKLSVSGTLDTPGGTISGAGSITLESGAESTGQCVWGDETVTLVYKAGSKATMDSATYLGSDSGALYKVEGATVAITKTTWEISGGGTVTANTYTGLGGGEYNLQSITVGAGSTLEVAAEKELRVATGGALSVAGTLSVEGTLVIDAEASITKGADATVKFGEHDEGNIGNWTKRFTASTLTIALDASRNEVFTFTNPTFTEGRAWQIDADETLKLVGTVTLPESGKIVNIHNGISSKRSDGTYGGLDISGVTAWKGAGTLAVAVKLGDTAPAGLAGGTEPTSHNVNNTGDNYENWYKYTVTSGE